MVKGPEMYEPYAGESVSETVIRAVAAEQGVDPLEMDACLYDVIDPHALDAVFDHHTGDERREDGERRLSFTFDGYRVAIDESRRVFVTEQVGETDGAHPDAASPTVLRGAGSPWQLVFQQH